MLYNGKEKGKRLSYSASQDVLTNAEARIHIRMHHQYFSERIYHAAKCCVQIFSTFPCLFAHGIEIYLLSDTQHFSFLLI